MFKLVKERTAWWPVSWPGVAEDGEIVEHKIELKFRLAGRSEWRAIFEAAAETGGAPEGSGDTDAADLAIARKIVAEDWRGVGGEDGRPIPFSWDAFAQLLDDPLFPVAFLKAYAGLMAAAPEIREKNSEGSPGAGRAADPDGTRKRRPRNSDNGARAPKR